MVIFYIFGLSSYCQSFWHSLIQKTINIFWITFNLSILTCNIIYNKLFFKQYDTMSEVIELGLYILISVTHSFVMLHVLGTEKVNKIWYQKLQFARENVGKKDEKVKSQSLLKISFGIGTTVLCSMINIYSSFSYDNLIMTVHYHFVKFVINLHYLQCAYRLDYFTDHAVMLRNEIERISLKNKRNWKAVAVRKCFQIRTKRHLDDPRDVKELKRMFSWLYESTKLIENCFGWSIIAMMTFTFMDLTANLYWLMLAVLDIDSRFDDLDSLVEILGSLNVVLMLFCSAYWAELEYIDIFSQSLMLFTNVRNEYNGLVKELALQLYHGKIENSANDFFLVEFKSCYGVSKLVKCYQLHEKQTDLCKIFQF